MTLSSRIAVMNRGRLEQVGTPGEVYEYPRNRFVADFVGTINIFEVTVRGQVDGGFAVACADTGSELVARPPEGMRLAAGQQCWIAVRPEKIFIDKESGPAPGRNRLKGVVEDLGYLGNLSIYRVRLPGGRVLQVSGQNRVRTARRTVDWDDEVALSWDIDSAVVLSE